MATMRRPELSDRHMIVLSWINLHPGHCPEDIAKGLRAEEDVDEIAKGLRAKEDVDEIAKLCADLAVAGFIEPMTRH